ncbi:MAG TPA: gephyrin-like molybdotransferase Glp [Burkholderiaceae bacterium]
MSMLTASQALEAICADVRVLTDVEQVATELALGRVLAQPLVSGMNVPSHDNTQMDGYAMRAADCVSGDTVLPVSQRIPAGAVGAPLQPGACARIFTGAFIPEGADCVVMQEQCEAGDGVVTVRRTPQAGEWIRRAGEDIAAGSVIVEQGTRLNPAHLGLAASVGLPTVAVVRRPKVAIFFTGDELTMPGEPLAPGAIYNSNRYLLRGLLQNLGCDVIDLGIVRDSLDATRAALRTGAQCDLIVTSGGVSVGEEDHVKAAVEAQGRLNLWQIAIKPGKPLAFGEVEREGGGAAYFLGLPGNPVSSYVTFLLFVRPFILRLQGVREVAPRAYPMRADFDWPRADKRNEFLRARVNHDGGLDLYPNQGSAVLTSVAWGHGLVDTPPGQPIARGQLVRFLPFSELS